MIDKYIFLAIKALVIKPKTPSITKSKPILNHDLL